MDQLALLNRMFLYDRWANGQILDAAKQLKTVPDALTRVISHLVAAQQLWLDRLHGDEPTTLVWPEGTIEDAEVAMAQVAAAWQLFIENQREEKLLRPIAYTNSKGQPWANRVEEIMHHVSLHSSYHRGQIALLLRQEGIDPPLTDFVHAVRIGALT